MACAVPSVGFVYLEIKSFCFFNKFNSILDEIRISLVSSSALGLFCAAFL